MKISTGPVVVVLPLLLLFADKSTDAQQLLQYVWRRLTRNTPIGQQQNAVNMLRPIQTLLNGTTDSQQETKLHGTKKRSSWFIDGTSLEFVYWNKELGHNKSIIIEFGHEKQILNYWIRGKPLKVITHGWLGSDEIENGVFTIKTAYVATEYCNVITVDWRQVAGNYMYPVPAYLTSLVGLKMAELLEEFVKLAVIDPSDIHIIGFSLGAHVVGACGSAFTPGKIGRITGLDPAGPGFEYAAVRNDHLDSTDAQFVDVIHTASSTAGYFNPIGHADFYPNGGSAPQPGCLDSYTPNTFANLFGCSHTRSYEFYADSVYYRKSYAAIECPTWKKFTSGECKNNTQSFMGHDADPKTRGVFYLNTQSARPFGIKPL